MRCLVCDNVKSFKKLKPLFCQAENYLCRGCGLIFIQTRSSSNKKYYKDDGYFKKSPNFAYRKYSISKTLLADIAKERVKDALKILLVNFKDKKVLDVGCGYGEIIYYLKSKYHSKVQGIEASPQTAKYGNEMYSVKIEPLLLEEFKSKEKFDVIWCSHVLEHVDDPNLFLKKIKNLLTKDGLIYIEVPNILRPTGGFNLNSFLYSEHLQTFSAYNFYILLKKNNLNVISYSDQKFLKFWCSVSDIKKVKVGIISANEILQFLKKYKDRYSLANYLMVYLQKMLYGLKLLLYKIYDLI